MNPKGNVQRVIQATFYGLSCFSLKHSKHQWKKKKFSRVFNFILEHNFLACYWVRSSNRYTINS